MEYIISYQICKDPEAIYLGQLGTEQPEVLVEKEQEKETLSEMTSTESLEKEKDALKNPTSISDEKIKANEKRSNNTENEGMMFEI